MKKLLIMFIALSISSVVFGQDKKMDKNMDQMDHKMNHKMKMQKDHLMMKDFKMVQLKNEKTIAMDKDMTLSNGTIVMMDGTVKMKNGKTKKMKNGDMIYMNGKMGKMNSHH